MTQLNPVKVLYVENGIGYGGAIICLRHLVKHLDRDRFQPVVVTGRNSHEYQGIANEAIWCPIIDRYVDVTHWRNSLLKRSWPDAIPGIRFLCSQVIARTDDIINFLPFFLRLFLLALRIQPVLIHVNNEPLCNRAGILVGKLLRKPVICHVRGTPEGSVSMRWFYRQVDHFIPVSHWISEGIGQLGVPEKMRTVVYDGIALEDLDLNADGAQFRLQHGIQNDAFAVGLVGLLIPWKGQRIFLDAAKLLCAKIPNLQMVILGGTPDEFRPYEEELKKTIKKESLEDIVVFTGHVSDMPSAYNGLDIVVSASTSPEPLGTVVIESMAMQRPLVAPNHGGAAEMCNHNENALLFQPGDASSLAEEIFRFYQSPALRDLLSKNARAKALKTFAVKTHVENVQRIYEKVLR